MAAEILGVSPSVIADWIQYSAAFVVAVIAGLAARFGWAKAKDSHSEKAVEVVAGVVDNSAIKALVEAIEHAVDRLTEIHDDTNRRERRQAELITELATDLRKLTRAIAEAMEKMKG